MKKNLLAKVLSLVLAFVMVFSVAACSKNTKESTGQQTTAAPTQPSTAAPSTAAPTEPETTVAPTTEPAPTEPEKMEGDEFGEGAIGKNGGVSSFNEITSTVGLEILKAGGNAIDAAVATAFAVGVVEPHHSGIGGCGMMTIYLKDTNEYVTIEYLETTPAKQAPGIYNSETDSLTAKNAAVPGQVYGLLTALEKYGTMKPADVLAPAIKLAREGFILDSMVAGAMADNYETFSGEGYEYELSLVTNDGLPYSAGDLYKNPDLADTLERIAKNGIDEFYKGETAEKLIKSVTEGGSVMSMEDLAAYKSVERTPISTNYYGYDIITVGPPSNGGDWLLEMLNIMEEKDIRSLEQGSAEYWRIFNEANRIGLRDTYSYLGDPDFFNLPIEQMTSKDFAKERAALIPEKGVIEVVPESNLPYSKIEREDTPESSNTTHIAVIDSKGNIVSTTNTVGNSWGCKTAAKGLGFFLNSHINNMNHSNPDSPDYIMPGKRVRSTISPTIVVKDGKPVMAIGSPGSLVIPPAIAAVINNALLYGMDIQAAINAPRAMAINRSSKTGPQLKVTAEVGRIDAKVLEELVAMGYTITEVDDYAESLGGIAAILLGDDGTFYAGADHRRTYKAVAY